MSDFPNVVKLVKVAVNSEQQDRENVNAFLESCKEQDFNALIVLGMRDGDLYTTRLGVATKIEALGMLQMAADAFLHNP